MLQLKGGRIADMISLAKLIEIALKLNITTQSFL